MKNHTSPETQSSLTSLGAYQIFGGFIGICILIWVIFKNPQISIGQIALLLLVAAVFSGYSIFCGILCLKLEKTALKHSYINQFAQVVSFSAFGLVFQYVAGVYLNIGLELTDSLEFDFGAGISKFNLVINGNPEIKTVSFNLVAIGIIFWIDSIKKRIEKDKSKLLVSELIEG